MSKRILVIDDIEINHFILINMFRELVPDHYYLKAMNAGDALEYILIGQNIDLIIIDYNMPGMNGAQTCRMLRALDCKSPMVLWTVHKLKDMNLDGAVFDDQIDKKIHYNSLKALLEKFSIC